MWYVDVVSATRRSSGVAPRACVRVVVYARLLVPPSLYIRTYLYLDKKSVDSIDGFFVSIRSYFIHTLTS